jgi:hypothetical protein
MGFSCCKSAVYRDGASLRGTASGDGVSYSGMNRRSF